MNSLPNYKGSIHFIGIGGIGMSAIAAILVQNGYTVQGSDLNENANTIRLLKIGVKIYINHHLKNLNNASLVIISSSIASNNIELQEAKRKNILILTRAQMLAKILATKKSIVVSGSHGKTTVTSLIACLLDGCNINPTVINGGIMNSYQTNAKIGGGDWIVAESDESDGSFLTLPSSIAILTNVDQEHLEYYGNYENLKNVFQKYLQHKIKDNLCIVGTDNKINQEIVSQIPNDHIIKYGENDQADMQAINIIPQANGFHFDIVISQKAQKSLQLKYQQINDVFLPMLGVHNINNALAAIICTLKVGGEEKIIKQALQKFLGVKRRFTHIGTINNNLFIDDYAHHPTEVSATLNAAKQLINNQNYLNNKIIVIFQPHRYTRLSTLKNEFVEALAKADKVIILPVFNAGEQDIYGVNEQDIVSAIYHQNQNVQLIDSQEKLFKFVNDCVFTSMQTNRTILLFMGAGSISSWCAEIFAQLKFIELIIN